MDTLSLFDLSGKTALITGSGSGIGFALAEGLAGAGAKIILNGRNLSKLTEAENKLKKQGATVAKLAIDVTQPEKVKNAIDNYAQAEGNIDILINNAGVNIRGAFVDFNEKDRKNVLDININGAIIVSQKVAPVMIKNKALSK